MDYAINRGYSPAVGRFQQADPYRPSGYKVDPQSWNRYSYTRNDPVNRIDPFGLDDYAFNETMNVNGGGGGTINTTPGIIGGDSGPERLLSGGESSGGGVGSPIDWDALWQRWKNANPCEKSTAISYPFAAFTIIDLREKADRWFAEVKGEDNTRENAVQHCYFSCLATIHLGFPIAKAFGDAHECNSEGNPENTPGSRHDLHNNKVGRTIGYNQGHDKSAKQCLKKCLASSDLRWLNGNPLP